MVEYNEIEFWTDKSKFNKVRDMLRNEYGLVPPKNDPIGRTEENILVWEDKKGIGRYRVHFMNTGPKIYYRYWMSMMTPEIDKSDPMLSAVQRTYDLVKPIDRISVCICGCIVKELGDRCP